MTDRDQMRAVLEKDPIAQALIRSRARNATRARLLQDCSDLTYSSGIEVTGTADWVDLCRVVDDIRSELKASNEDQEDLRAAQAEITRLRGELVDTTNELRVAREALAKWRMK